MTDNLIDFSKYETTANSDSKEHTIINRWTGEYSEWKSYTLDGKLSFDIRTAGQCTRGVSKLQTVPKF